MADALHLPLEESAIKLPRCFSAGKIILKGQYIKEDPLTGPGPLIQPTADGQSKAITARPGASTGQHTSMFSTHARAARLSTDPLRARAALSCGARRSRPGTRARAASTAARPRMRPARRSAAYDEPGPPASPP